VRDDQPVAKRKLRTLGSACALFAIAAGGVVWSGCGSEDETNTIRDQAEEQVEEGKQKAEDAVEEGVDKAKKGLKEGKAKAEKGLDEAQDKVEGYLP